MNYEDTKNLKSWVWKEAWKLKQRFEGRPPEKGYILFETGYGPSGLPHIGTFGEVFRTTMVKQAFEKISDIPTKLIAFSDDMDGLRKVPDNLPNQEMISENIGKPLTDIPDPFGTHESFGAHMNNRLKEFLDRYGFEYEFKSSTETYKSGQFNKMLLKTIEKYEAIQDIMLPTLGEERRKTYSPFMPLCEETGRVLQVPIVQTNFEKGTITYRRDDGTNIETEVTDGKCKLQWKPDWGMRWAAFGVDYEMHGKDLTPSAVISGRISKVLNNKSPINFVYEMFLDEKGEKISKSKGNGISIDEWLTYGTEESLSLFMFNAPQKAKKLHFDVIPQNVDDYLKHSETLLDENIDELKKLDNPVWHINKGKIPQLNLPINFALLLNLASACNPEDKSILWGFISNYAKDLSPENSPYLDKMAELAVKYYYDFIKPNKNYKIPDQDEKNAILALRQKLLNVDDSLSADEMQTEVFTVGKENGYEKNLRDWFSLLYMVLLGQSQGPRMGSFVKLFGLKQTLELIDEKVS